MGLRAVVRGRVQMVGFRDFAERRARALGLSGYVRNRPSYDEVEVVAEGPREALEALLRDLRQGPRLARVDGVEAEWRQASGAHRGFAVCF